MKQILIILSLIILAGTSACKKDKDDSSGPTYTLNSKLVGTWEHSSYSYDAFFGQITENRTFVFKNNGAFTLTFDDYNNDKSYTYTHESKGNCKLSEVDEATNTTWDEAFPYTDISIDFKITRTIGDDVYTEYIDLFENDTKMYYLYESGDDKKYRVYTKQ